jgi:inosose dehydratase
VTPRIANAPVSYGAFEWTVGQVPNVPGPEEVLDAMAAAGYEGTELGPPDYLGNGDVLAGRLERFGLELMGAYIPLRLTEPDALADDLRVLERTLDLLEATAGTSAIPGLAGAEAEQRLEHPGRAGTDPSLGLDEADWRRLVEGVRRAVDACRARGFEPAFHHHAGTHVQTPGEVERLLGDCDVGLLLDSGHLALCGGDPVAALRDWGERVNLVHLKDYDRGVLHSAWKDGVGLEEATRRGVFCPLGEGDADLGRFVGELRNLGYEGWIVVEQDRIPVPGEGHETAIESQRANRRWLKEHAGM